MSKLPKKYTFDSEDKKELKVLMKKVIKLVVLILSVKLLRGYLYTDETARKVINEILIDAPLEQVLQSVSIGLILLGVIGTLILYIVKGTAILTDKVFNFLFFFLLLDMIFLYIYPEITASIMRAVFLTRGD